jgi:hypothetical protein
MKPITEEKQKKYDERCRMAVDMIANNPEIIPLLKGKYTTDDVLEDALDLNPDIFKFIKEPSDRIIYKALDIDGSNIRYISKEKIKSIPEELLINAIENVDETLPTPDIDFSEMSEETRIDLFMQDPVKTIQYGIDVPEYFILKELQEYPNMIKYIKNPSNKMKCVALSSEPNIALYFDKLTDEMMDIIDEKYPHLKDTLPTYTRNKGDK